MRRVTSNKKKTSSFSFGHTLIIKKIYFQQDNTRTHIANVILNNNVNPLQSKSPNLIQIVQAWNQIMRRYFYVIKKLCVYSFRVVHFFNAVFIKNKVTKNK